MSIMILGSVACGSEQLEIIKSIKVQDKVRAAVC